MDITAIPVRELIEEIRRRSKVAIIAAVLKDAHPEANLRIWMHVEKGTREVELVGISALAHSDAMIAVRDKMMGDQQNG